MSEEITIENLRALVIGVNLNAYQRALALKEFKQLESKLKEVENGNIDLNIELDLLRGEIKEAEEKIQAVKDSLMSDEQIEERYPERNSSGTYLDYNMARRESVKNQRE